MSAKLVEETMKALKNKNAAEADEITEAIEEGKQQKKTKKSKKSVVDIDADDSDEGPKPPKKPRKNKAKGKRIKLTTISSRVGDIEFLKETSQDKESSQPDYESDNDNGDSDMVCGSKFKQEFPSCKCNPKLLASAYHNGKPYCKCGVVPLYQSLLCVDGWKTYNDTVSRLERKYGKKHKKHKNYKTEPNIIYYDPSTVPEMDSDEEKLEEAKQKALEAEDSKPRKKKRFAEAQAVESSGDEEEDQNDAEKREATREAAGDTMKDGFTLKVNPSLIAGLNNSSPSSSTSVNKDEVNTNKKLCPMCGDPLGTSLKAESYGKVFCMCGSLPFTNIQNQSSVLTRVRLEVLPEFKSVKGGCVPLCSGHNYPTRVYIFNPLEVDSKGKPIEISEEKKALKGRMFMVCAATKKIMEGFVADGEPELGKKCHYLCSAEFKTGSDLCNYFESLYRKVVVEHQKETRKAVTNFVNKSNREEAKRLAELKAEKAQWKKLGFNVDS